ncbi:MULTISPECIES: sigma-70 family RNA polymerase sigma factor [unclassified Salinibacterium]|uniref:RNA polymerase sigma factor n=1 Tax=unclassified Salinibacterium TaxID=2632331 RepID=UPI0014231C6C|nr:MULTISPECIES: sigma-70 family RNA polymerase sigma factor [unclassified Salinibacterium]
MTAQSARATATSSGSASFFEQLVQRESAALLSYFLRRVEQPADAADLVAETLLVLWRRANAVPADATEARMWMFGIAHRVLRGWTRSRRRQNALSERLRDELATTVVHTDDDGRIVALRAAIANLSPRDRELIRLVHWDGFTLAEAATVLGIRPGAARMRSHRIRERLRAELG